MDRIELSENNTGLNFLDHSYMVAGYLDEYKLKYGEPAEDDGEKKELTVSDFKENRGYVDKSGGIHIFREHPNKNEHIPWFTVAMDSNGNPKLEFNTRKSEATEKAFRIENVRSLSIKHIEKNTSEGEVTYDPEVLNDIARATSTFTPEIKDTDDFLKKLIKTAILEKDVNIHKYKKHVEKTYILSNLLQALSNNTRISPYAFEQWMELLTCDFEIRIMDNGSDQHDPLLKDIIYKSTTGQIIVAEKRSEQEEDSNEKEACMARSARQFN